MLTKKCEGFVSWSQVVAAYGSVPFPMMHGSSLPDALSGCADALPWKRLSACPEPGDGRCYGQWATLKGFEGQRLIRFDINQKSEVLVIINRSKPNLLKSAVLSFCV